MVFRKENFSGEVIIGWILLRLGIHEPKLFILRALLEQLAVNLVRVSSFGRRKKVKNRIRRLQ